jgi:hypothetical protein
MPTPRPGSGSCPWRESTILNPGKAMWGPRNAYVRGASEAAGFPNRDPIRPDYLQPAAPVAERHYYRTGRDTQFNTKVRADTKAAFIAIAAEDGAPLGKVLEDALDALMRERRSRKVD